MSEQNVTIVRGIRIALPPAAEKPPQRRGLDERLIVRFPALSRLLADRLMRLPVRSRLRRMMIARGVRQAYEAANRRDFDRVLAGWDPGSEYRPSADLLPPDFEAVFHGHDGYRTMWRRQVDAFKDLRYDPEEILDLGDKLLVTARVRGHGTGSGVAVSQPVFQLFSLRRGLVVRQEDFLDRSKALEAAGLKE
jgi:ketosteroid isomerase-like protein